MREIILNAGEEVLIKAKCGKCAQNESLLSSAILVITSLLTEKFEGVSMAKVYNLITEIAEPERSTISEEKTLKDLREQIYNYFREGR